MAAIQLHRDKEIPKIKIKVAHRQPATYKSWLKLPNDMKINLGSDNEIDLANVEEIQNVEDLKDKTYIWDVRVVNATGDKNEKYHVAVEFTQSGVPIHDPIVKEGIIDGNAVWVFDSVLFL